MTDAAAPDVTESPHDNPRAPLLRALRIGGIALVVITVLSAALWGWLRGSEGLLGVLIGAAIGGGFVLMTLLSVLVTARTDMTTTTAVVLGSWLLKMLVLIVVFSVLRDLSFYDKTAMVVTVVVAALVSLAAETWGVLSSQQTYVTPTADKA